MTISASMVKDLRDRTGAGMMDAKKALVENNGDIEAAIDWLRQKGIAKAAKKASRAAAEGTVYATTNGTKGVLVEVNSETDFVAKNEKFQAFVEELGQFVLSADSSDVATLNTQTMGSKPVSERVTDLVATIGENIQFRRAASLSVESGVVASYIHMGGKIGVLVAVESANSSDALADTARQVAMHVAAANPISLDRNSIDADVVARERAVYVEQAKESGKPESIVEKMVEGRMQKFYQEHCLTEQAFIMDTDRTVQQVLSSAASDAKISAYVRFALGEGVEKEESDFAAEVAAAVGAA